MVLPFASIGTPRATAGVIAMTSTFTTMQLRLKYIELDPVYRRGAICNFLRENAKLMTELSFA
jgi:hypothetical protein